MGLLVRVMVVWCLAASPAAAAETAVDLELVFAVDASGSVDDAEFRLQLEGIADALGDAAVLRAIAAGPAGRIAVNLLVWAEAKYPKDQSGWMIVASPEDATRAAAVIAAFPRHQTGGTGIGDGLAHALRSFSGNGITAPRRVVDVSGDGEETTPRDYVVTVVEARAMALALGATVNGLAIENEVPGLAEWYRDHVQTGTDSFVMQAADYADFAAAMRRKLLREISPEAKLSRR